MRTEGINLFAEWEQYITKLLKKHKMVLLETIDFSGKSNVPFKYRLSIGFHNRKVRLTFSMRSGLASLIIDDQTLTPVYDYMPFLRTKRLARLASVLVDMLKSYATFTRSGGMAIFLSYRTPLASFLETEGFLELHLIPYAKEIVQHEYVREKMWVCDLLPGFTQELFRTYHLFMDVVDTYEDKTAFIESYTLDTFTERLGYQIEYAGLSSYLELSYKGAYEWTYLHHHDENVTELTLEKRFDFLPNIKKSQRLVTLFNPPTFHFERFFSEVRMYSIHRETILQALKQDLSDEEIEVLFATRSDEIAESVKLLHEGTYRFYEMWGYYFAGKKQGDNKSFFANSLEELKAQVIDYENQYLKDEYMTKLKEFNHQMHSISLV